MADMIEYYREYVGLKLHFTNEEYNYLENRGNVRGLQSRFEHEPGKKYFINFRNKYTIPQFKKLCLANFLIKPSTYITELHSYEAGIRLAKWVAWNSNQEYHFKEDLKKAINFLYPGGIIDKDKAREFLDKKDILLAYQEGIIRIETLMFIYGVINPNKPGNHNKIWDSIKLRIQKYRMLVKGINNDVVKKILSDTIIGECMK